MATKDYKANVSLMIKMDLVKKVDAEAAKEKTNRSAVINQIIEKHYEQKAVQKTA